MGHERGMITSDISVIGSRYGNISHRANGQCDRKRSFFSLNTIHKSNNWTGQLV